MNLTTPPLDRRTFLRRSGALATAASLLPLTRFAHAAGGDTLKLALVGCGGRGSGAANQALKAIHKDLPFNEAERGAMSTMTCIMGRMAAYSGQQIEWEDALKSEKTLAPLIESWEGEPPVKPRADGMYDLPIPGKSEPV